MKIFHCVFYLDESLEDFALDGVFSHRPDAEKALGEIPDTVKGKCIVTKTLEGLKRHLIESALAAFGMNTEVEIVVRQVRESYGVAHTPAVPIVRIL